MTTKSTSPKTEPITDHDACIGCRECLHSCPENALFFREKRIYRDLSLCSACLECIEICPVSAHKTGLPIRR